MSASVSFIGHLGRDAELKEGNGRLWSEFSVAVNSGYGDNKETSWYKCFVHGQRAESLLQYLVKGKGVFIAGDLKMHKYTGRDCQCEKLSPSVSVNALDFFGGQDGVDSGGADKPKYAKRQAPAANQDGVAANLAKAREKAPEHLKATMDIKPVPVNPTESQEVNDEDVPF